MAEKKVSYNPPGAPRSSQDQYTMHQATMAETTARRDAIRRRLRAAGIDPARVIGEDDARRRVNDDGPYGK